MLWGRFIAHIKKVVKYVPNATRHPSQMQHDIYPYGSQQLLKELNCNLCIDLRALEQIIVFLNENKTLIAKK